MKKFLKCYDAVLHKDDFYLDETVETLTKNSKLYSLILKADNDIDQISLGFSDDPRVNLDDCFILVPSAVYDGNRFECIHIPYPPSIPQGKRLLEEKIIANDIPRLLNDGDNLFEHRLGSGASPIVALWDKHNCKGIIYAYSPLSNGTPFTESGFYITNKGEFNFCYPVVRKRRYNFSLGWEIGGDRYANIKNGETINFQVKKSEFACGSIEEFYDMVLQNRYAWGRKTEQKGLPLNEAFNTIKNKFNIHNWYEESGLYRTYPYEEFRTFSSGWCGGGFIPYIYRKLFEDTDSLNIERAHRFMNYIYPNTQAPSGLFYSQINEKGEITGDDFIDPSITSTHLIRRSADILFYHTSLFLYMQKQKVSHYKLFF